MKETNMGPICVLLGQMCVSWFLPYVCQSVLHACVQRAMGVNGLLELGYEFHKLVQHNGTPAREKGFSRSLLPCVSPCIWPGSVHQRGCLFNPLRKHLEETSRNSLIQLFSIVQKQS
jgi:hypothetical protein